MLKAVKECLKNWLVTHERLYWYIVVGLAVLGFGIVTAFGCAKLEKANAAETSDGVYYPDFLDFTWDNNTYMTKAYNLALSECERFIVRGYENDANMFSYYFLDFDTHSFPYDTTDVYGDRIAPYSLWFSVRTDTGSMSFGGSNYGTDTSLRLDVCYIIGDNYDIRNIGFPGTGYIEASPAQYSSDAPYVKFDSLNVKNDIASGKGKFFDSLNYYDNFIVPSYWEYVGHMENYQNYPGATYLLEVDFTAELPRLQYIQSIANKMDVDIQWMYNMVKWGSDLIDLWNQDALALKNTYHFIYNFPVDIDANGNFSFRLSYPEIENLIRYFSESARNEFNSYDSETLGLLLSFLHVDSCSISVKTTTEDSVLYGKSTVNHFERGVHDTCVEVEIDLDILNKSEEEIDKIIQDSISAGYEQYYKDLEDRVNSLEGQLGDVSNIQAGFGGNLETTDLWSGFTGLVQGLGSLAPAVQSLSSLTGVVLSFLPLQMSSIMATTMLAICVIAVIKAIRG